MEGMDANRTIIDYDNETSSFRFGEFPLEDFMGPKRNSLYVVIPITVIYVIILLSGLIGNISTCVVIARNKSMHTATNYYLFNLAISDLLLLISGLPPEIYLIWSRYPYVFGYAFCVLRGLFSETSANATVLTITAFTVERYVAICHPFLSQTLAKLSRIVKLILAIWIVAICFAVPQALQFEMVRFVEDVPESDTCQVVTPIIEHSFELSTFMFFFAPMTLITVLYVLIGLRLKSSTNMMKKDGGESSRHLGAGETFPGRNLSGRHQNSQSSRRVLKMLVAVVVAFFICWAPFHAQRLIATYVKAPTGDDDASNIALKIYEITTYVSGVLYYVSTTINPLLYNIMSNKFREAFKETFARCFRLPRRHHRSAQRSYSVLSRSATQRRPEHSDSGREEPSIHTNTTLVRPNSFEGVGSPCKGQRSQNHKSGSIDSDRDVVTFSWTAERAEIQISMVPKSDYENIHPNTKLVAVHVTSVPSPRLSKFLRLFGCVAEKTIDDGRGVSEDFSAVSRNENGKSTIELEQSARKIERFPETEVRINK